MQPNINTLKDLMTEASQVVIIQADNPDGDSLASALALEQILSEMGKEPYLYCGVDIPTYLHYMSGWDRVSNELPRQFDMSIIVDTSTESLLASLSRSGQQTLVANKHCIVIDHHSNEPAIPYATLVWNRPAVAAGEVIYELAKTLGWPFNAGARDLLAMSILSDSLGLTTEGTTARSIHIIGELVEQGVKLSALDAARRANQFKSPELVHYKGRLLQRVAYHDNDRVATIDIPWDELEKYSSLYNPPMLVLDDMRFTEGTALAIAFKVYPDGKITGKIRSNYGSGIADKLAEYFGGGGHAYASGFKITSGRPLNEIKSECIAKAVELLDNLDKEHADETVQHPDA